MHNQSFSALLEVPRSFKSVPKVEHGVNALPESAAVALHVWQCPYMKRMVLLPYSKCLFKRIQECLVIAEYAARIATLTGKIEKK